MLAVASSPQAHPWQPAVLVAPPVVRNSFLAAYLHTGIYPDVRGTSYRDMRLRNFFGWQVALPETAGFQGWAGGDEATASMLAVASGWAEWCHKRGLGEARRARCRGCLPAQGQVEGHTDGFRMYVCYGCAPRLHVASNRASN